MAGAHKLDAEKTICHGRYPDAVLGLGSAEFPLRVFTWEALPWTSHPKPYLLRLRLHMWSDFPLFFQLQNFVPLVLGQIGYAIAPMIVRGIMLGPDQPVILHLLDIEQAAESLNGIRMELTDAAFPLLKGVVATTDIVEACKDVNIAVMLGGSPRKEIMLRKDMLSTNASIYKAQSLILEEHAAADCKVSVVANLANTNALILKQFAPSIPKENITCLTRLDHNRALGQIADRLKVHVSDVKNQHGVAIIKAQKALSAFSAAIAACDHIRDWVFGTPKGTWVSMGVYSDGSYGIPPGLIYSFPVKCEKGKWSIVQGLKIDEYSRAMMDATAKELIEEKSLAKSFLE
uniref:Malate dehydrogenase n=1 Tax=Quercus lobata TaxID=97700 RepID=A0A7N2LGN0_QUELO